MESRRPTEALSGDYSCLVRDVSGKKPGFSNATTQCLDRVLLLNSRVHLGHNASPRYPID